MPANARREIVPSDEAGFLPRLDWTGRQLRSDKWGAIPDHLAPLLDRLHIDVAGWPAVVRDFPRLFRFAAGRAESLAREARRRGRQWLHGMRNGAAAFG